MDEVGAVDAEGLHHDGEGPHHDGEGPQHDEVRPPVRSNIVSGNHLPSTISNRQYASQLAQLFLCGTSGWAVSRTSYDLHPIAFGAFTFLLGHGLFGILKVTMSDVNKMKIGGFYDYSEFLAKILPLPLLNTQIYFTYDHNDMISYGHALSSLFPAAFNALNKQWSVEGQTNSNTPIVKLVSYSNIGSLGYIGVTNENFWAVGLSVLSLMNELALDLLEERYSAPKGDYNAIALAFFNIFAVHAIGSV